MAELRTAQADNAKRIAELESLVKWMRDKWAYSIDGYYGNLLEECDERMEALGLEVDA